MKKAAFSLVIVLAGALFARDPFWSSESIENPQVVADGAFDPRGDFTWCAWVRNGIDLEKDDTVFVKKGYNTSLILKAKKKGIRFDFWPDNPGSYKNLDVKLPKGEWFHVAAVMDAKAGAATIYLNGRIAARTLFAGEQRKIDSNVMVGAPALASAIAGARIFHVALAGTEVAEVMKATANGRTVPSASLEKTLAVYADGASSKGRLDSLRRELPRRLAEAKTKLSDIGSMLDSKLKTAENIRRERVGYRREIADRTVAFVERELGKGTNDGLYFAELGLEDLNNLLAYFQLEIDSAHAADNPEVLNVKDFGAKGDGVANDSPAFKAVFEKARGISPQPVKVVLPEGEYLLKDEMTYGIFKNELTGQEQDDKSYRHAHVALNGFDNLTIEGAGSAKTRLVYGQFNLFGFRLSHSRNCTVRGLSVRWQKTPCFQGVVTAFDAKAKTVDALWDGKTMEPEDPDFGKSQRTTTYYDADNNLVKSGLTFWDGKPKLLATSKLGRLYRFTFTRAPKNIAAGYTITIAARSNWYHAFNFSDATLCTAEDVTVHNSRAGAFSAYGRFGTLVDCKIKPYGDVSLCTAADGCFCSTGTALIRCDFERTSDDGVNAHSGGRHLAKYEGAKIVGWQSFNPGQVVRFVDPLTGQVMAQSVVKTASVPTAWGGQTLPMYETELVEPLPAHVKSWESMGKKTGFICKWGAYTKPGEDLPVQIYAPGSYGQVASVVVDNRFSNIRSSGIVVQSSSSLIRGNRVFNPSWQGLRIGCLLNYGEGPAPHNVLVEKNTFDRTSDGIIIQYMSASGADAQTAAFRGIEVKDNVIKAANPALNISCIGDSKVVGNRIDDPRPPFIRIRKTDALKFKDNTFNGTAITDADIITQ